MATMTKSPRRFWGLLAAVFSLAVCLLLVITPASQTRTRAQVDKPAAGEQDPLELVPALDNAKNFPAASKLFSYANSSFVRSRLN